MRPIGKLFGAFGTLVDSLLSLASVVDVATTRLRLQLADDSRAALSYLTPLVQDGTLENIKEWRPRGYRPLEGDESASGQRMRLVHGPSREIGRGEMKLGAVDYLPKPFTPEQVRNAARRAVSETLLKRQLSELRQRIDERPLARYPPLACPPKGWP
jgi:hypothetical protein